MTSLRITVDDRLRLVTAVLAASDWPEIEQKERTHAVHPHAKQTLHATQAYKSYPAVYHLNEALMNGVSLDDLLSAAVRCTWPDFTPTEPLPNILQVDTWIQSLAGFAQKTEIVSQFWPAHQSVWDESANELTAVFQNSPLPAFLAQVMGKSLSQHIVVMPNLVYPALKPVLATSEKALTLLLPPPGSWRISPWPYEEDPGWVVARICERLLFHLLASRLAPLVPSRQEEIVRAAITLCLEQSFDEFEAKAYLLRSKKAYNLPNLPQMVDKLRELLPKDGLPQNLNILF